MKYLAPVGLSIIVALGIVLLFTRKQYTFEKREIEIGGHKVKVELADTVLKQSRGLMYRKALKINEGMLFVFPKETRHSFWMANTYIPLDIIWINADKRVVHIEKDVPSCTKTGRAKSMCTRYHPDAPALYVLEVNAGWADAKGIDLFTYLETEI